MKSFNVLIITGGTGGHIFPGLAAGDYLEFKGLHVLYLASGSKIGLINKNNVIYFKAKPFSKNPIQVFEAIFYFMSNLIEGLWVFLKVKPCVILATGSYAVVPFLILAIVLRIPFYLMEQNVLPGIVNKAFAPFSKGVFIAFKESANYLQGKVIHSGLPLRTNAKEKVPKEEARDKLNLPKDKRIVLVIGGSLGARGLVEKILPIALNQNSVHFIIQTGQRNYEYFKSHISSFSPENLTLVPFIEQIGLFYSAADLVISRAGANSCMEIVYHEKPAILVPYPYSRDKHQYENAKIVTAGGKAVLIDEKEIENKLEPYLGGKLNLSGDYNSSIFVENCEEIIYREITKYANCKKV